MASGDDFDVVTGVGGYTGKYIARRLLAAGRTVRNLTGHPQRPTEFSDRVESIPFRFDDPAALARQLHGARTLFNTYWVRFPHAGYSFEEAVENTKCLMSAARMAGVTKFVHVSIANPDAGATLAYYRGKAELERFLKSLGLPYAILRPTVIFGREDILINNIAWFLRHLPLFGVPGDGRYGIQPIYVEDMADLAVRVAHDTADLVIDAVGPETFAFRDLVKVIRSEVGSHARLFSLPPGLAWAASRILGPFVGDVVLTREEIKGLMENLLVSSQPPTGRTAFSRWLHDNREWLGTRYASEVKRHFARA